MDDKDLDLGRVGSAETGSTRSAPEAPAGLRPSGDDPARVRRASLSVYEKPVPAVMVLAGAAGVTVDQARAVLVALVEAGYGIAPRQPTNGMLAAYIEATTPPKHHEAVITAIGKARVRWTAMLAQGTAMALSFRHVRREPEPCEFCGAGLVKTSYETWECGDACPVSTGEMAEQEWDAAAKNRWKSTLAEWLRKCDSDRSGEGGETAKTGSTEGESAGPKDIAQ